MTDLNPRPSPADLPPPAPPPLPPGWSGPIWRDQRQIDAGHLRLLAIFHFAFAALGLVGIAFLGFHYYIMNKVFTDPKMWQGAKDAPPADFFAIFQWVYVFGGVFIVVFMVLNALSGWGIVRRKARVFSMIVAGLDCLQIPFGTALGIFTLIVLARDTVRQAYEQPVSPPAV